MSRSTSRMSVDPLVVNPRRHRSKGATTVEFALVGSLLVLTVLGIISACWFVVESQVANYAVQAAARWSVAAANFDNGLSPPAPWCSTGTAGTYTSTSGVQANGVTVVAIAAKAAGPFSGAITSSTLEMTPTATTIGTNAPEGCEFKVVLTYASFGGLFKVGPTTITAYAVDYVT
jgi:Flp pilus assembly protein TadG